MVNVKMAKELLDTEMTVVRNEFERGENNARGRCSRSAWRRLLTFGTTTANRPSARAKTSSAYRSSAWRLSTESSINRTTRCWFSRAGWTSRKPWRWWPTPLGRIPRPTRVLDQTYTVEPPQDGERFVELKRVGQDKEVLLAYHGPASAHPDSAALQVLAGIMTGGEEVDEVAAADKAVSRKR